MRVDQLTGSKVVNDKGEEIGRIKSIVRDKENKELSAVVGVGGIANTVGERDVTIRLRDMARHGDKLAAPAGTTKAQLEKMPEFDDTKFDKLPDDQVVTIGSRTASGGR